MSDVVYKNFMKRWEEVVDVPPQQLGPLTPYYKSFVRRLKVMPLPAIVLLSLLLVLGLYILIGPLVTTIVSILQRGI